jgi:hypothetical protein
MTLLFYGKRAWLVQTTTKNYSIQGILVFGAIAAFQRAARSLKDDAIDNCECKRLREKFVSLREEYQQQHGRAYDDYCARIEEAIKSDPKTYFGYVDLKKKHVGYPSVMHFEGRLASGFEEVCDLLAKFIQQIYADDVWVPSDPGPEHVPNDPPFGTLQFTLDEIESV